MPASELNTLIDSFGDALLSDLRKSLVTKGVIFGGGGESKLSAKMRFEIKQDGENIELKFLMPSYGYYVNKGREPGPVSKEGQASISDWVKPKGIVGKFQTDDLAKRLSAHKTHRKSLKKLQFDKAVKVLTYLISRKLKAKGYKATHFIDDVVNDGRIKAFGDALSVILKKQIIVSVNT